MSYFVGSTGNNGRVYTDADDDSRFTDTRRPSHPLTTSDVTHHHDQQQQQQQQQAEERLYDAFLTTLPTDVTPPSPTHHIFQSLSGERWHRSILTARRAKIFTAPVKFV